MQILSLTPIISVKENVLKRWMLSQMYGIYHHADLSGEDAYLQVDTTKEEPDTQISRGMFKDKRRPNSKSPHLYVQYPLVDKS